MSPDGSSSAPIRTSPIPSRRFLSLRLKPSPRWTSSSEPSPILAQPARTLAVGSLKRLGELGLQSVVAQAALNLGDPIDWH